MVFLTVLFLIGVVFYVGLSTDFQAFAKGAQQILYALTGRNAQGNFVAYPGGSSGAAQTFNY